MMKPETKQLLIKTAGTAAAAALCFLATTAQGAAFAPALYSASALLCGWLHIPRPGDSAAPKA